MTLLDDYVDALLDGTALDAPNFEGERRDGDPHVLALRTPTSTTLVDAVLDISDDAGEPASTIPPVPHFLPAYAPAAPEPDAAGADAHSATHLSSTSSMATSHRWLRVNVGHDSYALELLRVQEVVRLAPIVALRGAAHAVIGVMNLRGRIVPVVDLGLWLDAGCVHGDERSRIVVVERDDEMIGMLVSAVEDIVTLGHERIEPPLASSDPGAIVGIARVGATPTVLLDANALFG
ncbi:MAG: chemotaxis protein CheW [Thermomonas sp.]